MINLVFLGVVILFFWIANLSARLGKLEKGSPSTAKVVPPPPVMSSANAAAPVVKPEVSQEEIATGWLTKIGVVALLFGMGFFLKYAIEQGWIGVWGRILLGFAAGALLMVLGDLWRNKFAKYAAALSGGGLGLLYFSAYAGYHFYSLYSQSLGLGVMVIFSLLGVVVASRNKSLPLGVLAAIGAYLTPIMLYSGRDQQLALFFYLTIINLAAAAAIIKYYWHEIFFVMLFGVGLSFGLWSVNFSTTDNVFYSVAFLLLTALIFFTSSAWGFRFADIRAQLPAKADQYLGVFATMSAAFFVAATSAVMIAEYRDVLPYMIFLYGLALLVAYCILAFSEKSRVSAGALAALTLGALALAAILQFHGKGIPLSLIVLGLIWFIAGRIFGRTEVRVSGFTLLIIALALSLLSSYDLTNYLFLWNTKFGLMLASVISLFAVARLYAAALQATETGFEKEAGNMAAAIATMCLWFAVSWEIATYFRDYDSVNARNLFLSLWWIAYGVVLILVGALGHSALFRKLAIAMFALSILKVFLYDVQSLDTGYRVVSFIVLGVILLSVSYFYHRNKEKINTFLAADR